MALHQLNPYFMMKRGLIGDPDVYLGSTLQKVTLENGVEAWALSPSKNVCRRPFGMWRNIWKATSVDDHY